MTTTDIRPPRPTGVPVVQPNSERRGPLVRIVSASIATGALAAAALVLGIFPGATEDVTTGVALLAFAAGWTMLAVLSARMTSSPQQWAYGLAAVFGASGLALVALAPGDDVLTAVAWIWPLILLVLVSRAARQMRASTPGRSRWLLYPVLGVLTLSGVGAVVEDVAAQRDANITAGLPGALYDVGGHRLLMSCTGTGSPTVVLESGLGGTSPLWSPIMKSVSRTTRVCAYDRAGTGRSERASRPQDSLAVTADLHQLLARAGETGPFVLVGHSTGGVYSMTYAARYPDQVAGMVLLDSASPRQFTVLPDYDMQYAMMTRLYGVLPSLARVGLGRVVPTLAGNEIPGEAGKQARAIANAPRSIGAARGELALYRRSFPQALALTSFGNKPLIVVSASDTMSDTKGWSVAQQQLAALSTNASHRTATSSHLGLLEHPGSYPASIAAIADAVRAVRTSTPVRTP